MTKHAKSTTETEEFLKVDGGIVEKGGAKNLGREKFLYYFCGQERELGKE